MDEDRHPRKYDTEEQLKLAEALFRREDRHGAAKAAFRRVYPHAPDEMIESAVFHIYTDGVDAALCFIAGAEMFLRDPHEDWLGYGESYELLYHVHNWHVLRGFMPKGTQELVDGLDDLKGAVASGDAPDDLLKRIGHLRDLLTGEGRSVPDIDAS